MSYPGKTLNDWADEIHDWAVGKGWWDQADNELNLPTKFMLIDTEVAEAMEAWRKNQPPYYDDREEGSPLPKPEGWGAELADVIIRVLDIAGQYNLDMNDLVRQKMEYNATRAHRHGGKQA